MEAQLLRTIILTIIIIIICHIGNGTGWRFKKKKKLANVDSSVSNGFDVKKNTHKIIIIKKKRKG